MTPVKINNMIYARSFTGEDIKCREKIVDLKFQQGYKNVVTYCSLNCI